jgi:ABC-type branched-subunit amino acid transport system substrate-binding protein
MRYLFILFALWTSNSVTASAATLNGLPPIRIGVSNVQSGASKSLGQQLMRGSDAYFAFVNNSGGIYGRKVEVILKDDRYEPDPAVENTNDLMTKDKVFLHLFRPLFLRPFKCPDGFRWTILAG